MQLPTLPTFATLGLLLSLPLATVAQVYNPYTDPGRCQSGWLQNDTDKELIVPTWFEETFETFLADFAVGSLSLLPPQLNLSHNGTIPRLFCIASDPSKPRMVSCFMMQPESNCSLSDFYAGAYRLDTYKREVAPTTVTAGQEGGEGGTVRK